MNLPKIDRRGMNHKARWLFANRTEDVAPEVLAALDELVSVCNRHDPVFGIHVDASPGANTRTAWIDWKQSLIYLPGLEDGRPRSAESLLISLSHEVGHLLDRPTSEELARDLRSPRRQAEREEKAWAWAMEFLHDRPFWARIAADFAARRERFLDDYRRAAEPSDEMAME